MILTLLSIIATLVTAYFLFVAFYPSFGGEVSKQRQSQYAGSIQFDNGKFVSTNRVNMDMGFLESLSLAQKFFIKMIRIIL